MSELAVRQIDFSPLLEQLDDSLLFPRQDAVDRVAARRLVVESVDGDAKLTLVPAVGSLTGGAA